MPTHSLDAGVVPAARATGTTSGTTPFFGYDIAEANGIVEPLDGAAYYGSVYGQHLVAPIVALVPTPDHNGYWQVGADGSVYAFGDAQWSGNAPAGAAAITSTGDGHGYWVVGSDGLVTNVGDAGNFGDLAVLGVPVSDIVGIVPSEDGLGYLLIGRDGGVFGFGDAGFSGSLPALGVRVSDIVGAVPA